MYGHDLITYFYTDDVDQASVLEIRARFKNLFDLFAEAFVDGEDRMSRTELYNLAVAE